MLTAKIEWHEYEETYEYIDGELQPDPEIEEIDLEDFSVTMAEVAEDLGEDIESPEVWDELVSQVVSFLEDKGMRFNQRRSMESRGKEWADFYSGDTYQTTEGTGINSYAVLTVTGGNPLSRKQLMDDILD